MPTLKQIVENNDTPAGRAFDLTIQTLIVLSMVAFSMDTLPNLPETVRAALHWFEVFSVIVFTVEYLLRVAVASARGAYIVSFFGIIDLLAILPYFIGLEVDLRSVRACRLLRLFRLFKLARYSAAVRRFHLALNIAKEEIVLFLCATIILLFLAAVGIYYFEGDAQPETFGSVFHCLWWAVETLSTVGYGDVSPVTVWGKAFTLAILLIGLGVIAVPAGLVATALAKARELENAPGDGSIPSSPNFPAAANVHVDGDVVSVDLIDGRTIVAPISWYPRLSHGTAEELNHWRLIGGGRAVHWSDLSEEIRVEDLLAGRPSGENPSSFKRWLDQRRGNP